MGKESLKDEYKRYTGRKIIFILVCTVSVFILMGLSIYFGGSDLSLHHIYELIWNHICGMKYEIGTDDFHDDYVVWNIRMPRTVFAVIAGAGLAAGGAVMQSVMKNPLADPYTTGISSGACFGMALAIVLGITVTGAGINDMGGIINAFIFALIPVVIVIVITQRSEVSPATLILVGVAITYIFNAFTTILMMISDSETLATVYRWQIGSFSEILWRDIPVMAAINLTGIFILLLLSRKLNILSLGDNSAKSLGLDVDMMRIVCLLIISFMIASVVCYCGIIGFVGLIIPHIVRKLIQSDNLFVIPASAAFGAVFLLAADTIARYLSPLDAIPVGVVMAFIGSPLFLFIIIKSKKEVW